jgi:hypothetical protein
MFMKTMRLSDTGVFFIDPALGTDPLELRYVGRVR